MSDYDYYDIHTGEGLMEHELETRYDDMLDGIYGEPMGYPASRILAEVDPIAYRCGFSDWVSGELGETITEDAPADEDEAI
jgi:hypothetical protein